MRRVIEFHATQRAGSEPATYRLALPYVVFVVGVEAGQIVTLSNFFRTSPIRSIDDQLSHSCLPNTSDTALSASARCESRVDQSASESTP